MNNSPAIPQSETTADHGATIIPFPERPSLDVDAIIAASFYGRSGYREGPDTGYDEEYVERVIASSYLARRVG
jgi:hypothetical protein